MDEKRIRRVYDIVDTFSREALSEQLYDISQRHPEISDDKYLKLLKDWHPNLLNGDGRVLNPGLKLVVLARLCYNLRQESAGFYTGSVRHSELILNTPHNELNHFFAWRNADGELPTPSYERTLANLVRVITATEERQVNPQRLADAFHKMAFEYTGSDGRHVFSGVVDVDGQPGGVNISFRPDRETKLRYSLFYARKP